MNLVPSDPILSCSDAKAWEAGLLKGDTAEWNAMQQAGAAIAVAVTEDFKEIGGLPTKATLLVLVGKGHNGGDALLAAQVILDNLPQATADILLCFEESTLRPLARRSLEAMRKMAGARYRNVTFGELKTELASYDLCVDGVFGFQFRPPMNEAIAEMIVWVNTHPRIRFRAAVDLPSGTSEEKSKTVFRADFTYATGIVKSPVVIEANAACVGRLRYLDLGFFGNVARLGEPGPGSATPATDRVLIPAVLQPLAKLRSSQSDKRTFGHLCIVGGSHGYPGAVVLAARAALRSGVGLVTVFVPDQLAPQCAAQHPEAMWVGCPLNAAGGLSLDSLPLIRDRLKRATALLVGPGLGADGETLELVRQLAAEVTVPLVLDADALRPRVIREVQAKPFVCTPHAGEFKRIASALYADNKFLAPHGVLVLKGPLTHITDGQATYYSPFGGPVLARGGSGDMLAGLIGSLLAQEPKNPVLAACRGVVWHGRAADLLARAHGQVAVENSQLLEQLGPALLSTHGRLTDGTAGVHGSERPA
jgi:NAD(P)H-hydrate epimerase